MLRAREMMTWKDISALFWASEETYTLRMQTSMILISLLCLMVAQTDAMSARKVCCTAREHMKALRMITRTLFRVANLLLIYASIVENSSLMQIYLWYTLAYIVVGFGLVILDMLLGVKHNEKVAVDFTTEVVFLFVLSQCLPLVDTYRKQLIELAKDVHHA